MRRPFFLGILILSTFAVMSQPNQPQKKSSGTRIVFMGNSITAGWDLVKWFPGKDYINKGISGQTTAQMLARFDSDVLALDPDVAVILGGTNDLAGLIPVDTIFKNIVAMGMKAYKKGVKVVFSSVLPVSDCCKTIEPSALIIELNMKLRQFAAEAGFLFVDYHHLMRNSTGGLKKELTFDGVHVNIEGCKVMTETLNTLLRSAGY